ncbi:ABC transporter substrate-binding protein [Arundinibacter roseus]|nr:ABC transporter substrate-binding protein [Arundinibacter roseus]
MQSSKYVLIILLMITAQAGHAQLFEQTERKFKEGVNLYNQGKYQLAMEAMSSLTTANADPGFSPVAHYYHALSAHKLKKFNESNLMLKQLLTRFSTWNHKDEAYYLLGANYFSLSDYRAGLDFLNRVGDPALGKDIQGLKQHYLANLTDIQQLKTLNAEFRNDRIVAEMLVAAIQSKSTNKADLELSDRLTNQFGIQATADSPKRETKKSTTPNPNDRKWTKGFYNVAVLFPYRLEDARASKRNLPNQFAYDYFEGMQLARQRLKSEGVLVNIQAYDVSNEEDKVLEMLNNGLFRQSDLIFGPLYSKTFDLISAYANENAIPLINPLATDGSLLQSGESIFLAHPSIDLQISETLKLAKAKDRSLSAAIYYGTSPKDSLMAATYRRNLLSSGGKVVEIKKVSGGAAEINARVSLFEGAKPSHIVLFSNDAKSGPGLMNVVAGRKLTDIPVFAVANSFDFNRFRPSGYGGKLYLIEPDFIELTKESIREFQKTYYDKTNTLPSVYSYQGYDQLLFFGRMIAKYNERVQTGITMRKYDEDYLLSGFDYTKSRENSVSCILHYEDSRWVPVQF